MEYRVSKKTLLTTAGTVWLIAGINILRIGIMAWTQNHNFWLLKIAEVICVFCFFFNIIFYRLYNKYIQRITNKEQEKHCPFSFFDIKGWSIMIFMIVLGITVRQLKLLPESFISVFYTGISLALIITGSRFIRYGMRNLK